MIATIKIHIDGAQTGCERFPTGGGLKFRLTVYWLPARSKMREKGALLSPRLQYRTKEENDVFFSRSVLGARCLQKKELYY